MKSLTQTQIGDSKASSPDHLIGDGLNVKMNVNKDNLWVEGDGCRVTLATNSGFLRVTGDGCRIHITKNLGSVEYTGDGGRIILGSDSINPERVKYRGDGGSIQFGDVKERIKDEKKVRTKTTKTMRKSEERGGNFVVTKVSVTKKDEERNRARRAKEAANSTFYANVCIKQNIL